MKVMLEFDSQFPLFHNLNTVEPPFATTSHKQPPVQNTTIFPVKALELEPLVNDHLLHATTTSFWALWLIFSIVFKLL